MKRHALTSGHWPSLLGAWLHFEVSFVVWILIGALGIAIAQEFDLSATQKGVLVAIPLLGGALLRMVVGALTDQLGAKQVGLGILWDRNGGFAVGMAVWSQLRPNAWHRSCDGGGGGQLCHCVADCEPRISPEASGTGHGDRSSRQQRGATGHFFRAASRRRHRMAWGVRCDDRSWSRSQR